MVSSCLDRPPHERRDDTSHSGMTPTTVNDKQRLHTQTSLTINTNELLLLLPPALTTAALRMFCRVQVLLKRREEGRGNTMLH